MCKEWYNFAIDSHDNLEEVLCTACFHTCVVTENTPYGSGRGGVSTSKNMTLFKVSVMRGVVLRVTLVTGLE